MENGEHIVCFERICRLCLNDKTTLTDIFEPTTDNNNFSIDQKILACATISLAKNDGLPSRICIKCVASVNAAFDFRLQCENADKTLHILHNLLTGETDKDDKDKPDKQTHATDAITANVNKETEKVLEKDREKETNKEKIDIEQVILLKKAENEDKLVQEKGNLFYIIKDNDGGLMEGILSEAEIIYFDNGSNSELSAAESADGKIVTEIEYIDEDEEVLEEGEEMEVEEGQVVVEEKRKKLVLGKATKNSRILVKADEIRKERAGNVNLGNIGFALKAHSSVKKRSIELSRTESSLNKVQIDGLDNNEDESKKTRCPFCHKKLVRVEEHVRLMHRNRIYICNKHGCGAQFATLKNLQSHHLTCYDLKKAYKCPYCFKEFHRKSNYKAHVRRHNSKKEFKCQLCDSAFVDTTGLRRHFLKHHEPDRELFVSDCCGKSFKSKEGLKKHINKRICGIQVLEVVDPSPIEVPV